MLCLSSVRQRLKKFTVPLLLLLPLIISVALAPQRLPRFILGFGYTGPLVDVKAWQKWVKENPDLFGPLGETARFAIVSHPDDSTGVIVTRERDGLVVKKSHFIVFQDVLLLLQMSPQTALEMRTLNSRDGDQFWNGIKYLTQSRNVRTYANGTRAELDRVGLIGFLQVLDAIPPDS